MALVVGDASLILRWLLPGEESDHTREALRRWEDREVDIVVPALFWAEAANGLFQALRQDRIDDTHFQQAVDWLTRAGFPSPVPDAALFLEALDVARQHGLPTPYDAMYLALARRLEAELWHSDGRLVRALGGRAPEAVYFP